MAASIIDNMSATRAQFEYYNPQQRGTRETYRLIQEIMPKYDKPIIHVISMREAVSKLAQSVLSAYCRKAHCRRYKITSMTASKPEKIYLSRYL